MSGGDERIREFEDEWRLTSHVLLLIPARETKEVHGQCGKFIS
jgi:hypothetical protein